VSRACKTGCVQGSHAADVEPFASQFITGPRRPNRKILGTELAGEVEETGAAVTEFEEAAACDGRSRPGMPATGSSPEGRESSSTPHRNPSATAAVQLARYFHADVTAACNTEYIETVRSLGADKVIDCPKKTSPKTVNVRHHLRPSRQALVPEMQWLIQPRRVLPDSRRLAEPGLGPMDPADRGQRVVFARAGSTGRRRSARARLSPAHAPGAPW
jgi:hypothetical protein